MSFARAALQAAQIKTKGRDNTMEILRRTFLQGMAASGATTVLAALGQGTDGLLSGIFGASETQPSAVQTVTAQETDIYAGLSSEQIAELNASMTEILSNNQFGLVYSRAITENIAGQVNIRPVSYQNMQGVTLAANVYLPAGYSESGSYPAIVVAHPNGGVKEQVSGLFAQRLAENGYVTLAFDAAYQGASGGLPRNTDLPANRTEDIRAAVDYLTNSVPGVDSGRIGALGICGGGGYTINVSKTDKRIGAVATISMFNTGRVRRNGMSDADVSGIPDRMQQAATARALYTATGEVTYIGGVNTQEQLSAMPAGLYRDGVEYYGDTHYHPHSQSRYTAMSLMDLMAFDAEDQVELIDQPLLMIAGDISDTRYMTEGVFEKSTRTDDKELFLAEGAQHIETYWKEEFVRQEMDKLLEFFDAKL